MGEVEWGKRISVSVSLVRDQFTAHYNDTPALVHILLNTFFFLVQHFREPHVLPSDSSLTFSSSRFRSALECFSY